MILPRLGSLELLFPLSFIRPLPNDALSPLFFLLQGLAGGVPVFSAFKLGVTGLFTAWTYDSEKPRDFNVILLLTKFRMKKMVKLGTLTFFSELAQRPKFHHFKV